MDDILGNGFVVYFRTAKSSPPPITGGKEHLSETTLVTFTVANSERVAKSACT